MKPATDPSVDYKALVKRGYDRCAEAYNEARQKQSFPQLGLLASSLPEGAAVLDIGCGAGLPVTRALAERFVVTGVDISSEQLRRARRNVPEARFVHSDIMALDLARGSFDAVVAFFVIFHLPRREHAVLIRRIYSWLKPGGLLLATLSVFNEAPYTEDDFFGAPMYWSNFGQEEYASLLTESGFRLLRSDVFGHGYSEAYRGPEERHPLVLCRKP